MQYVEANSLEHSLDAAIRFLAAIVLVLSWTKNLQSERIRRIL
jgi:hypothetical protein